MKSEPILDILKEATKRGKECQDDKDKEFYKNVRKIAHTLLLTKARLKKARAIMRDFRELSKKFETEC